jgi:NAD(P)H-dependent flavin oxidoreductase YrpB (nitropropane dioxygenase family)
MEQVFKTRITELLGIRHPITQGGMMWVASPEFVSAVSNAGALGIMTALTYETPQELAAAIARTRELTSEPFAVNLTLLPTLVPKNYDAYVDTIISCGVKIVETAGRNPEPYMEKLKGAGIKVIHKCTGVRFAKKAEAIGCDVVSIDGFECAGHPGEQDVTSLILIPRAADALQIPIIASGGFGDARGLVAALALGADAMNMGTRFMATEEAPIHPNVKQWLVGSTEVDTLLVMRSLKNTARVMRNAIAEQVAEMESKGAPFEELAPLLSGKRGYKVLTEGALDHGILTVGQVAGLIDDVPTIQGLVDGIMGRARELISGRLTGALLRA